MKWFSIDCLWVRMWFERRAWREPLGNLSAGFNAILPVMFIKEMNKLVTLRLKHDRRANLSPAALFLCVCRLYTWASRSDWQLINLYVFTNLKMSGCVCVRLLYQQVVNCPTLCLQCERRFWHRSAEQTVWQDEAEPNRQYWDTTQNHH